MERRDKHIYSYCPFSLISSFIYSNKVYAISGTRMGNRLAKLKRQGLSILWQGLENYDCVPNPVHWLFLYNLWAKNCLNSCGLWINQKKNIWNSDFSVQTRISEFPPNWLLLQFPHPNKWWWVYSSSYQDINLSICHWLLLICSHPTPNEPISQSILSGFALRYIENLSTSHHLCYYHPGPCHIDSALDYC